MYKPTEPIRCPKCGAIVNINLTSDPPCREWTCPNCGEIGRAATSGYIQKIDEHIPDPSSTTTNNSEVTAYETLTDPKPTACDIPVKPFLQQGWECPKCGAILAPHQHYCPFCSPSEYGRSNWIVTTPAVVPSGQYTNPNPNTTISSGGDINFPKGVELTLSQRGDIIDVE